MYRVKEKPNTKLLKTNHFYLTMPSGMLLIFVKQNTANKRFPSYTIKEDYISTGMQKKRKKQKIRIVQKMIMKLSEILCRNKK